MGTPDPKQATTPAKQVEDKEKPSAAPELGGVGGRSAVQQGQEIQDAARKADEARLMAPASVGAMKAYRKNESLRLSIALGINGFERAAKPTQSETQPDLSATLATIAISAAFAAMSGLVESVPWLSRNNGRGGGAVSSEDQGDR